MQIRHCVEKANVNDSMSVIDPLSIRHVTIKAGKISSLSGLVNPSSHLNLDYPIHLVRNCVICKKFEVGSEIEISNGGFVFALVGPNSYKHYGRYDYNKNLQDIID
jgi:hypothetical protein